MRRGLVVGDKVMWRGSGGTAPPEQVTVTAIVICGASEKHGRKVVAASWRAVQAEDDSVTVYLDNGRWAYGNQIEPVREAK